jgi:hypothetical protein
MILEMPIRGNKMPIPFALIGIGVSTAVLGIGKTIKAATDNSNAANVNESANSIIDEAKTLLENARKNSGAGLKCLGQKKVFMLDKSISRFISSFEKLKNVDLKDSAGLSELQQFKLDSQMFKELKDMYNFASSLIGGAAGGALGGALTAFGAYGAATMFATASTGTAIASLSGAAATNATLAFFGGGALAAGGLGVAGGTVVLGGLVAGPALAIMGFVLGAKADTNLNNAYSNLEQARQMAEELKLGVLACNAIRRRSFLFERLLIRLDYIFLPLIIKMETTIKLKGDDYSTYTQEEKNIVAESASIALAIKAILDTPILTKEGELTEKSKVVAEKTNGILDKPPKTDSTTENKFIFCVECGKKLSKDITFCTECGTKVSR